MFPANLVQPDDPRSLSSFLNVRYAFGPPGFAQPRGWNASSCEEGRLFENLDVFPRAVPGSRYEARGANVSRSSGRFQTLPPRHRWRGAGGSRPEAGKTDASVRAALYAPEKLTLDIDARDTALVATDDGMARLEGGRREEDAAALLQPCFDSEFRPAGTRQSFITGRTFHGWPGRERRCPAVLLLLTWGRSASARRSQTTSLMAETRRP